MQTRAVRGGFTPTAALHQMPDHTTLPVTLQRRIAIVSASPFGGQNEIHATVRADVSGERNSGSGEGLKAVTAGSELDGRERVRGIGMEFAQGDDVAGGCRRVVRLKTGPRKAARLVADREDGIGPVVELAGSTPIFVVAGALHLTAAAVLRRALRPAERARSPTLR